MSEYDQILLKKAKETFDRNGQCELPPHLATLASEWDRSREFGIPRLIGCLPEKQRNLRVFEQLDKRHFVHLSYLKEYYVLKNRYFEHLGAALFYLDSNLSIFNKGGDDSLLESLKSCGIRMGSTFSEECVGVFPANIALSSPFATVYRIGEENWCDLFSDYVCYARHGRHDHSGFAATNMVLLPMERFNESTHAAILYALGVEDITFKREFLYPPVQQKMDLLEKSAQCSPDAFLLVDTEERVVFVDDKFKREFGKSLSSLEEAKLADFMPEFKPYLAMLARKAYVPRECFIANRKGESRFYQISCQQVIEDGSILGLRISVIPPKVTRNEPSKHALFTFASLIGESPAFKRIKDEASQAASSVSNVLITGESGTGKEMLAQAIHNASPRKHAPFIPINCGAIPKELIGSELFGYEGGAFTGARREGSPGKFEQANGGTVFLDEIAEMPLDMQSFLLRFLEDGVVSRIGSKKFLKLDVRIIAATNKDPWECVNLGTFRLDLYFRLNVLHYTMPPLRERTEDLGTLVHHFLSQISDRLGKEAREASPAALELLQHYPWPGNLRELRNVLERCVNTCEAPILDISTMPPDVVSMLVSQSRPRTYSPMGSGISANLQNAALASELRVKFDAMPADPYGIEAPALSGIDYRRYEAEAISRLMIKHKGNKTLVAKEMGISRSTLYRKLRSIGNAQPSS